MAKILGLDLGSNSIGWAIRNTVSTENQIEKAGVVTFQTGVGRDKSGEYSYAAERTKKRSVRRLYQARKYRLWDTLAVLIEMGYCPMTIAELDRWRKYDKAKGLKRMYPVDALKFEQWVRLDFDGDGVADYTSPYQLRAELAEMIFDFSNETDRYKLGRALYHIAQRRGFKSSRKASKDETKEDAKEEKQEESKAVKNPLAEEEINLQRSELKKNYSLEKNYPDFKECKTIGVFFARREKEGIRVRHDLVEYSIRQNYKDEIKYIFEFQGLGVEHELYQATVEDAPNRNNGTIFYKRPLRSQKGSVGICTLEGKFFYLKDDEGKYKIIESGKKRCSVSHPVFEEFRALCLINNIKFKKESNQESEMIQLPKELRKAIYEELFFRRTKPEFKFEEISGFFKKKGHDNYVFNYKDKTTISASPVTARLRDIFGLKQSGANLQNEVIKNPAQNEIQYTVEEIWHILFTFEDQEYVEDFAKNKLGLQDKSLKAFITLWNTMPAGYGMLSVNAMNKINRFLQKGLIYTEAVMMAQLPGIFGQKWDQIEEQMISEIKDVIAENRKQKKMLSIVNGLIAYDKNSKNNHRDLKYSLSKDDSERILSHCEESFGLTTWGKKTSKEKGEIISIVTELFQSYFRDGFERINLGDFCRVVIEGTEYQRNRNTFFYRMPKLEDTLKDYLVKNFEITLDELKSVYHPSDMNIYPPAQITKVKGKDGDYSEYLLLGSPKIGAFKNPMAMRTLHELRRLVNHLIVSGDIDSDTRVVVEVGRELNDNNKRWAIETWQRHREDENLEYAAAIKDILSETSASDEQIDKVRMWKEQGITPEFGTKMIPKIPEDKKNNAKDLEWSKSKTIEKYKLWKEQSCICLYTGKVIRLADLLSSDNLFDIEHTIPRSVSFDNSLANRTICEAQYNRNIKQKRIPSQLPNHHEILERIKPWEELVERIKLQINFWKQKSKQAMTKDDKDKAIRQKHLWQMDLDYWENKVNRFKMKEVTSGFKNSQLVDTQIASKYAFHYLKTVFEKVDVQKGSVTADFRKIYQIQPRLEKKDRSQHSHHAVDATVLTFIPSASKRDQELKALYEAEENRSFYHIKPYLSFSYAHIEEIQSGIAISNRKRDRATAPANKKLPNGKIAKGDSIRGQLHQESFYGAIKLIKKDENGKFMHNENGWIFEPVRYVIREPFVLKTVNQAPGFKDLPDLKKQIVDQHLYDRIEQIVNSEYKGDFKEALKTGVFLKSKTGVTHRIRHVRIFATSVQNPVKLKKQTYQSSKPLVYLDDREHKESYFVQNSSNHAMMLYQWPKKDKKGNMLKDDFGDYVFERSFEIITLIDVAKQLKSDEKDDHKNNLYAILKPGDKVIFYENRIEELPNLAGDEIIKRLYVIRKFKGNQMTLDYNLEARDDNKLKVDYPEKTIFKYDEKGNSVAYGSKGIYGFTESIFDAEKNLDIKNRKPWPRLLYTKDWFNFAVEGYHFEMLPDGTIEWKI